MKIACIAPITLPSRKFKGPKLIVIVGVAVEVVSEMTLTLILSCYGTLTLTLSKSHTLMFSQYHNMAFSHPLLHSSMRNGSKTV